MHPPQSPYLQVALPLIEDVKGGEGLSSLWRVFTKCQESIQDGSRLENISWRCVPSSLSSLALPFSWCAGGWRALWSEGGTSDGTGVRTSWLQAAAGWACPRDG